nr:hypothetical protein [Brucella intermedia]
MNYLRLAGIALVLVATVACTKPESSEAASSTPTAGAGEAPAPAADTVSLFNAYTASSVDAQAQAVNPAKDFSKADAIYIAAVVHGEAESANVRAEWSLAGGPVLGSVEKSSPVHTAQVVTLAPIPGGTLEKGSYMAIVSLNGKPQWELPFQVND